MACFTAALAECAVVYGVRKILERHARCGSGSREPELKWSRRLAVLMVMLAGGSFLLCIEHIWHGEIVPFPPFFTALEDPGDTRVMLQEIFTAGLAMDAAVTALWFWGSLLADKLQKPLPGAV